MQKPGWLVLLRAAALLGLSASVALLVDYSGGSPAFCSASSGCGTVRASEYAYVPLAGTYVPLPAFGVAGFLVLFALSLTQKRALTLAAGALGGLLGLSFLVLQGVAVKAFCWLCVAADVSALAGAASAALLYLREPRAEPERGEPRALLLARWAWLALLALAVLGPLGWSLARPQPPVPAAIQKYYAPGKINVVEFADFQCPACRRFHGELTPALHDFGEKVNFVRLNKPLRGHPFAHGAALAAVCGEQQGKKEAMADALFKAPDLEPPALEQLAAELELDVAAFKRCVAAPETAARVDLESALLVPPELEGLPTTYIGAKRLLGVQSEAVVRDALARAERGEGIGGIPGAAYAALLLAAFGGVLVLGRNKRRAAA